MHAGEREQWKQQFTAAFYLFPPFSPCMSVIVRGCTCTAQQEQTTVLRLEAQLSYDLSQSEEWKEGSGTDLLKSL